MDDKGQVYFNADYKEIPSEDATRLEKAQEVEDLLAEVREHHRLQTELARERDRTPTDKQRAHIEKRTRFTEALRKEEATRFGKGYPEA